MLIVLRRQSDRSIGNDRGAARAFGVALQIFLAVTV
jgi:hypothetical protein